MCCFSSLLVLLMWKYVSAVRQSCENVITYTVFVVPYVEYCTVFSGIDKNTSSLPEARFLGYNASV